MPDPLKIPISYLSASDRLEVGVRACAWSAEMASAEVDEVLLLAGAMAELREWMRSGKNDQLLLLKTLALTEAQLLIRVRMARAYAELAGAYLPAEVQAGLDAFPKELP